MLNVVLENDANSECQHQWNPSCLDWSLIWCTKLCHRAPWSHTSWHCDNRIWSNTNDKGDVTIIDVVSMWQYKVVLQGPWCGFTPISKDWTPYQNLWPSRLPLISNVKSYNHSHPSHEVVLNDSFFNFQYHAHKKGPPRQKERLDRSKIQRQNILECWREWKHAQSESKKKSSNSGQPPKLCVVSYSPVSWDCQHEISRHSIR